jgi:hypothetical protein
MGDMEVIGRSSVLHKGDPKGGDAWPPGGAPHDVGDDQ